MQSPLEMHPEDMVHELVELNRKVAKGIENLSHIRNEDIQVGFSPKEEVYREDNIALYRYTPVIGKPFHVPLVIVYALVNRLPLVDLQENLPPVPHLLN